MDSHVTWCKAVHHSYPWTAANMRNFTLDDRTVRRISALLKRSVDHTEMKLLSRRRRHRWRKWLLHSVAGGRKN